MPNRGVKELPCDHRTVLFSPTKEKRTRTSAHLFHVVHVLLFGQRLLRLDKEHEVAHLLVQLLHSLIGMSAHKKQKQKQNKRVDNIEEEGGGGVGGWVGVVVVLVVLVVVR